MDELLELKNITEDHLLIELNREEVHNAFNEKLILDLTNAFKEINKNKKLRLITLTGKGRSFCAGADLNWMGSMINYSKEENFSDSQKLFDLFQTIDDCAIPVLAKVNGHALGGGVGLLSVCDFVITHEKAKFGFTEARLGLIPAVISSFCMKKIGVSHARAWFLSGETFSAQRAKEMALVNEVSSLEDFEKRYDEVVTSFLKAAPEAAKQAKKLIKDLQIMPTKDIREHTCRAIAELRVSDEAQEGMSALLQKRKANWMQRDE